MLDIDLVIAYYIVGTITRNTKKASSPLRFLINMSKKQVIITCVALGDVSKRSRSPN